MNQFLRKLKKHHARMAQSLLHPRVFYGVLISIVVLVIIALSLGLRLKKTRVLQRTLVLAQDNFLDQIDAIVSFQEILSEQNNALLALSEEALADLRADTQAQLLAAGQQLADARKDLGSRIDEQSARTTRVIETWRPRVALVTCEFSTKNGDVKKQGSGTLFDRDGIKIITNKHVVNYDGITPDSCSVGFTGVKETAGLGDVTITIDDNLDVAYINFGDKPSGYIADQLGNDLKICSSRPSIGDRLVILGYPSIGSSDDVTATEGILSGYEGDYLITSAKVEQGNSGGAAISVSKNCYAGIPTFVQVGATESLARILDVNAL